MYMKVKCITLHIIFILPQSDLFASHSLSFLHFINVVEAYCNMYIDIQHVFHILNMDNVDKIHLFILSSSHDQALFTP